MTCELDRLANLDCSEKERLGIVFTPSEIRAQAGLWRGSAEEVFGKQAELGSLFSVESARTRPAGSGAHGLKLSRQFEDRCFLRRRELGLRGKMPCAALQEKAERACKRIRHTTMLLIPKGISLRPNHALLCFARSGNSPESLATYEICPLPCKNARFLVVTYNPEGNLARLAAERPSEVSLVQLDPVATIRAWR